MTDIAERQYIRPLAS